MSDGSRIKHALRAAGLTVDVVELAICKLNNLFCGPPLTTAHVISVPWKGQGKHSGNEAMYIVEPCNMLYVKCISV